MHTFKKYSIQRLNNVNLKFLILCFLLLIIFFNAECVFASYDPNGDEDGDHLINSDELLYGTNMFDTDTDDDSFDDGYEVLNSTNPLDSFEFPQGVSGNIISGNEGKGLKGVEVQIIDALGNILSRGISDDSGNYIVSTHYSGSCIVKAKADIYADLYYDGRALASEADTLTILVSTLLSGIDFVLYEGQSPAYIEVISTQPESQVFLDFQSTGGVTPYELGDLTTVSGAWGTGSHAYSFGSSHAYNFPSRAYNFPSHIANFVSRAYNFANREYYVSIDLPGYPRLSPQKIKPEECEVTQVVFEYDNVDLGSLTVKSIPDNGAEIFIDYQPTSEVTPHTFNNLQVGPHFISISKSGFIDPAPRLINIDVQDNDTITFDLEPRVGNIKIGSNPDTADIYLDFNYTGYTTPHILENVAVGSHTIKLKKAGFWSPPSEIVFVDENDTNEIYTIFGLEEAGSISGTVSDYELRPLNDIFTIIYDNNELVANLKFTNANGEFRIPFLPAADYKARTYSLDYADEFFEDTITIETATPITVNKSSNTSGIDFVIGEGYSPGSLNVTSSIPGAEIYLDFQNSGGVTPYTLNDLVSSFGISGSRSFQLSASHAFNFPSRAYNIIWREYYISAVLSGYPMLTPKRVEPVECETVEVNFEFTDIDTGALLVESLPISGANIMIDYQPTGQVTPYVFNNLEVGSHFVSLHKDGYVKPQLRIIKIDHEDTAKVTINLEPAVGSLKVMSNPSGAEIFLDYESTGLTTPHIIENIAVGLHSIKVKKSGFNSPPSTVTYINKDETREISILFGLESTGSISGNVRSDTIVALGEIPLIAYDANEFVIDMAMTNVSGEFRIPMLPPTDYKVRTTSKSHADRFYNNVINIDDASPVNVVWQSNTSDIDFILEKGESPGRLEIMSSISDADIYIDNLYSGEVTPFTFTNISPGSRSVEITKIGFPSLPLQKVTIEECMTTRTFFDFKVDTGSILISSEPGNAWIFLDNQYTGYSTPYSLSPVAASSHSVSVWKQYYEPPNGKIFTVPANETIYVNFVLTPQDIDEDGLPDYWEYEYIGNLNQGITDDNDTDMLTNIQEYSFDSNPILYDTDYDFKSDFDEYIAGTDPNDSSSLLRISQIEIDNNGNIRIRWDAVFGKCYNIYYSNNLDDWMLAEGIISDEDTIIKWLDDGTLTDTHPNSTSFRFYKLDVLHGFWDDIEQNVSAWTATGFWHLVNQDTSPYAESHSGSHSWWYGQDATGDYDNGVANSGYLISPFIAIPANAFLSFWSWEQTEGSGISWDTRTVYISADFGAYWEQLYQSTNNSSSWNEVIVDLRDYQDEVILLKFEFDTIDNTFNFFKGWYIDDIKIIPSPL